MSLPKTPVTQTLCDDTVEIASDSLTTPSSLTLISRNPSAGAPIAWINSPLPAVGTTICLQLNIIGNPTALEGGIDIRHTIMEGDTPATVATAMADWLNTGPDANLAANLGIYAVAGIDNIAFTNIPGNLVELSDQTAAVTNGAVASAFTIQPNGSPAWDAGPVLLLRKAPGGTPASGSSIGQLAAAALNSAGIEAQYVTCNYYTVDADTASGGLEIFTKNAGTSAPLELLRIDETGCWILGKKLAL